MKRALIFSVILIILIQSCLTQKRAVSDAEQHVFHTQDTIFRLLTYNVLTGFQKNPEQAERFIEWVKEKKVDVIALQELSSFTQDSLETLARRYGHNYAILHKGNGSPIGITSRFPLEQIEKISGTMHHGCIYARVAGFHLFVTHLSPFSYEKCMEEMHGILMRAAAIPAPEKVLIIGDLNSFSPQDSLSYPVKRRYGVVQSLLDSGYTDAYQQINRRFESSFPTTAYLHKAKMPTRIDYVFANKATARYITAAGIIKDNITAKLSDHYPLLVTFK